MTGFNAFSVRGSGSGCHGGSSLVLVVAGCATKGDGDSVIIVVMVGWHGSLC